MSNSSVLLVGLFLNKTFSNLRSRWTISSKRRKRFERERRNKTMFYPFYEDNTRHWSISTWPVWLFVQVMDHFSWQIHLILHLHIIRWSNTNSSRKKNNLFSFHFIEKNFVFSFTCEVSKTSCNWIKFEWLTSVNNFTSLSKNKAFERFPGWEKKKKKVWRRKLTMTKIENLFLNRFHRVKRLIFFTSNTINCSKWSFA